MNHSGYALNPIHDYNTFSQLVAAMAGPFAERTAVTSFGMDLQRQDHTYGELAADIRAFAQALWKQGLAGRHTAIVAENSYQWLVAFYAVMISGGLAVCVDIEQADTAILDMVERADSEVLIASPTFVPICTPLSMLGRILIDGPVQEAGWQSLAALCSDFQGQVPPADIAAAPDQTAVIVYTSGTTNTAKAVMLGQRALLKNAGDSSAMVLADNEVFTALPFYHTYGLTCGILGNMGRGAHLTVNGNLRTLLRDLKLSGAKVTTTVPLVVETLYKYMWLSIDKAGKKEEAKAILKRNRMLDHLNLSWHKQALVDLKQEYLGKLEMIVCGGARLDPELAENLRMFGVLVLEGYGITEYAPLVAVNRNQTYQMGTVGHIVPDCELKLVEDEIWIKGPCLMQGYYKNPELTAAAFEDGWFKTGDLGRLDAKGLLAITGRAKNLIVFKNGKKLSPERVEDLLYRLPMVKDVIVYGALSGAAMDEVKLAVSIYPDPSQTQGLSAYEVLAALQKEIDALNKNLPTYQQIQMVNIRENEFAKTAMAKIKRHTV